MTLRLLSASSYAAAQWEVNEHSSFMLNGVALLQVLNASAVGAHVLASP